MRILLLTFLPLVIAFAPNSNHNRASTKLDVSRRDAILTGAVLAGILHSPIESQAFSQQLDDNLTEVTQLPTGGKLDLNSAYVGDYKQFRGMFPTAAGKIASHGPYKTVKDIYKIEGLKGKRRESS
mmetsp:Transcript_11299/g.21142  ORF Transcript_11299/g.21142 Transcript_11299/m.21142 type:complete len:126 (+) Transcript_11299:162-539(+)